MRSPLWGDLVHQARLTQGRLYRCLIDRYLGACMAITGGCACRRIRYECDEKPLVHLICHCFDCQKASGSEAAALIFVPCDRVRFTCEPKYYEVTGASGRKLQRGFCPQCGSPVSGRWPAQSMFQLLQVGSLDDRSIFDPSVECWVSRAEPWHVLHPSTVKFDQAPSLQAVRGQIDAYFARRAQAT